MHFLSQYGLFLLKTVTLVAAILIVTMGIAMLLRRQSSDATLSVSKLNEKYEEIAEEIRSEIWDKKTFKQSLKKDKKDKKALEKKTSAEKKAEKRRLYVLRFEGDIRASEVENLREEISAVLLVATPEDEVVVLLESGGGTVDGYGLGASQLQRIRDKKIQLTVCIDKVAASGGYLMACVADKILAAPFAIIGSIGVVFQMPNFNKLLKKHHVDYEVLTSGEYKRTMTVFGENTEKGRKKCLEELEVIHDAFKQHIADHRPQVDIKAIGTGEHWLARKALEWRLVDELMTSDDYLMKQCDAHDVFEVVYEKKKKLADRVISEVTGIFSGIFSKVTY